MRKELIFPTPLYIFDLEDQTLLTELSFKVSNFISTNDNSCQTTVDSLQEYNEFKPLVEIFKSKIDEVLDDIKLIRDDFKISAMWANISDDNNRHALHTHANSYLSGVLYLNAPQPSPGNIGFKDPRYANDVISFEYEQGSIFGARTVEVQPKTGRLIIFPSWLMHGTKPGTFSNKKRISLSFNVMPIVSVQDFTRKYNYI